jgi:succinate-semialdehyde dehydrogenase / glutarate-semialdehyde dehydrogenase
VDANPIFMALKSTNPASDEVLAEFEEWSDEEVVAGIARGHEAFKTWRKISFADRAALMKRCGELLTEKADEYGKLMMLEMGKPISQGIGEAKKCTWVCDFYVEKAEEFLAPEVIATDASESFVRHDPIGIILAVMPWNYPFYQVIRAAAPTLMAGNTMILKHASNVPQCGMALEKLFLDAGFPEGVFQYFPIGSSKVAQIIDDSRVRGATLTGSEHAGSKVAEACGRNIKKTVLELGGNGAFIVLDDADLDLAAEVAVSARFQNCGQSCIAAKRFIVVEAVYDEFLKKFEEKLEEWSFGDPADSEVQIGPMYSIEGLETIEHQVAKSVAMGAHVVAGGLREGEVGAFYRPTILSDVTLEMPVMKEETFGPVAAVYKVADEAEAIEVSNDTCFGLGASLWTQDSERAKRVAGELDEGGVFVNGLVKSDPRLPFGGVKKSGYGRELSHHGIKEFVNVKTVWIK